MGRVLSISLLSLMPSVAYRLRAVAVGGAGVRPGRGLGLQSRITSAQFDFIPARPPCLAPVVESRFALIFNNKSSR